MNKFLKIGGLLLTTLLLTACHNDKISHLTSKILGHGHSGEEPLTVVVMEARFSESSAEKVYVGTVKASNASILRAPAPGTVVSLSVREGEPVKQGCEVARIESQPVCSAYEMAKARLSQAQDGLERAQKLFDAGSIPEVKMVEVRTLCEQAQAAEKAAADAYGKQTLRAPFDGVVDRIFTTVGVEAAMAEPLVSIVDITDLTIDFSIPENEFSTVQEGRRAKVEISALNKTVKGKVLSKGVTASLLSHSYNCSIKTDAPVSGLMPGMVCKVILSSQGRKSLIVPASAVKTDGNGRFVWTVEKDCVNKVYVRTGGFSGDGVILSEGIEEGDEIIIEGSRKVSSGMRVNTQKKL
ncbi:MAG: efflux RND transporter periplasmic adaptor subunit [Bacteroidales bacterium]|nr:efflux RND transporter periplasmic adaptor subunit [Bacteroidales bacterium]MBQ2521810.1 efflux RND transporter periplasmic adaptor subunit [Bacteroidales bacterium]MBQ7269497.1 efflux RND transporter periplasmic adaptor subunit [Bacteroidales bacterium]